MLRVVLGMVSWCERRGESSSLGVCAKTRFLGFWSSGFGKREKIRKKLEKNSKSFRDQKLGEYGARDLDAWLDPFNPRI